MKAHWKGTLLVLWLLSQTLGFALPARSNVAGQASPQHVARGQSQPGNHGYDGGFASFGDNYDELPGVTMRGPHHLVAY